MAEFGLTELRMGVLDAPIVKGTEFEVDEPDTTVTLAVPADAMRLLDTEACN